MATKYNKSAIMKNAHRHHARTINETWSEAMKWAWALAKQQVADAEASAKRSAEYKAKYGKKNEELNRVYANVRFGRNDWAVDYGKRYRRY